MKEEDKALNDATNPMWLAKNGFRVGYLQLERMIRENFPQTMLKAIPNIKCRVKLPRSKTTTIADILRMSGFDWNDEISIITCNRGKSLVMGH